MLDFNKGFVKLVICSCCILSLPLSSCSLNSTGGGTTLLVSFNSIRMFFWLSSTPSILTRWLEVVKATPSEVPMVAKRKVRVTPRIVFFVPSFIELVSQHRPTMITQIRSVGYSLTCGGCVSAPSKVSIKSVR